MPIISMEMMHEYVSAYTVVRAISPVNGRDHFRPPWAPKPLNRSR